MKPFYEPLFVIKSAKFFFFIKSRSEFRIIFDEKIANMGDYNMLEVKNVTIALTFLKKKCVLNGATEVMLIEELFIYPHP